MEIASCSTTATSRLLRRSKPSSIASRASLSFVSRRAPQAPLVSVSRPRRTRSPALECKCLFRLGVPEMVVIAGVAALVFGPKKLPEIGKTIGKTVKGFQQTKELFFLKIPIQFGFTACKEAIVVHRIKGLARLHKYDREPPPGWVRWDEVIHEFNRFNHFHSQQNC